MTSLEKLKQFRNYSYQILGNGRAALFDLMDAVLTTRSVSSFVELSLSPVFRREWPSLYEALQDACPPRQLLMSHYVQQMPKAELTIVAGDHTAWSRAHAKTLQDRTYEHQPKPDGLGKPVVVGQGYSTLAWIPEEQGSWASSALAVSRHRLAKLHSNCVGYVLKFQGRCFFWGMENTAVPRF
jgi:hypothetical protein